MEAMARSMEIPISKMEDYYFAGGEACTITSMCSVFAESEVINLINDGLELPRIVKGLVLSLAARVASLSRRLGLIEDIAMTGGVAKNQGVQRAIEKKLKIKFKQFSRKGIDIDLRVATGPMALATSLAPCANATKLAVRI